MPFFRRRLDLKLVDVRRFDTGVLALRYSTARLTSPHPPYFERTSWLRATCATNGFSFRWIRGQLAPFDRH